MKQAVLKLMFFIYSPSYIFFSFLLRLALVVEVITSSPVCSVEGLSRSWALAEEEDAASWF